MRGVFFGVEYDNDEVPNAIVIAGTRSGKFTKWVNEYMPVPIKRADGLTVLRERRCIKMPNGFHLRKDEILGAMKEHKTENWQDGKFFVLTVHAIGHYIHPHKLKLEKAEKEQNDAIDKATKKAVQAAKRDSEVSASVGGGDDKVGGAAAGEVGDPSTKHPLAENADASDDNNSPDEPVGEGSGKSGDEDPTVRA